jgi:hypothetical protein
MSGFPYASCFGAPTSAVVFPRAPESAAAPVHKLLSKRPPEAAAVTVRTANNRVRWATRSCGIVSTRELTRSRTNQSLEIYPATAKMNHSGRSSVRPKAARAE